MTSTKSTGTPTAILRNGRIAYEGWRALFDPSVRARECVRTRA